MNHVCCSGGIAGAASRITGAMAKGVAAITMDEEYQQKRREAMNKQPSGLREGLTRGGKGLVSVCKTVFGFFGFKLLLSVYQQETHS